MEIIKVNEFLNGQTTISKTNNKVWEKFMKVMEEKGKEEKVLFDFRGMELYDPWANVAFQTFMKDERVHIKLYSSSKEAATINQSCLIAGVSSDRCTNEDIKIEKRPSSEEKKLKRYIDRFAYCVTKKDETLVFDYEYSTITERVVFDALNVVLENNKKDLKKIVLNFNNCIIQDSMFQYLADMYTELSKEYEVELILLDKEMRSYADAFISTNSSVGMSELDKLKLFESCIKPNSAGVLTVYQKSKKKDALGRNGEGEVLFTRPSIYKGISKGADGTIYLSFESFKGNKFYRKLDYALDNGDTELSGLDSELNVFSIDEIGVCDKMKGTKAHFNNPISFDESDMHTVYVRSESGYSTVKKTLPEYMKIVFDDHEIDYDKERLDKCIEVNRIYLEKKKNGEI